MGRSMHVDMSLIQHRQPLMAVEWILNGHIQPFAASWLSPQPTSDQAAHLPGLAKPTATDMLYKKTVLVGGTVIIEDDSFSLGMPTPMEILEQHAVLLEGKNEQFQLELFRARSIESIAHSSVTPAKAKSTDVKPLNGLQLFSQRTMSSLY